MSIRVLIVDDEKLERVLILKAFDWEKEGFEIIGEAGNGEEALEFFKLKSPDLIITDINMPYMDGVQLAEQIKKMNAMCRVVMVTGYREFEYARQALRIGVEDFLLKPINIDEIKAVVQKIKGELEEQMGYHNEYRILKADMQENKHIVMESFLQRLVENRIGEEEGLRKLNLYSLEQIADNCICMNIKVTKNKKYDTGVLLKRIQEDIKPDICFIHYMDNIILYFTNMSLDIICILGEQIKQIINQEYGSKVEIGISNRQVRFQGISSAYHETEEAIAASVILGRNRCITYKEYEEAKPSGQEKTDIRWKDFIFNVESGVWNKAEEDIIRYCDYIKRQGILDKSYIRLMGMDMISKASTILSKHGKSLEEVIDEDLYESIKQIESIMELEEYLKKVMHRIMEYADSIRAKKGNSLIDSALKYINENLHDSELSLRIAAKELYVNESYLSRVFKQETGESLIEYITRNRIEESIRLLNTTDMKAYEIAEFVGIKDPHYFSICFKKQVGVTIKEYKNRDIV